MYRKMMIGVLVLTLSMMGACHEIDNHARTSAVHDGMRALGLVQRDDGSYEFKLCEMAESYTAEVLREQCINPLVATDGLPLVLTEIPDRPGTFAAHSWNWGITALAAAAVAVGVYVVGRYIAKLLAAKKTSYKAYILGLEEALNASKKYDHFELPERVHKILKEKDAVIPDSMTASTKIKTDADGQPVKDFITDEFKLASGREVDLRELLVSDKKLRKSLKDDETEEISTLLLELEQSLKSGLAYQEVLEAGIEQIKKNNISLSDAAREFISNEKELQSKLASLKKNSFVKHEYHAALQELDTETTKLLARDAKSITSRQRNVARLKAAAGLNDVLKAVEGADEGARIAAQMGNEKLLVLSEDGLRNMVEEFSVLVNDSQKSAADVKAKLAAMQDEITQATTAWQEIADDATEIADGDVTKGISSFIKATRRKQIKGWSKDAKEAEKALKQEFKTPHYESEAKKYEGKISEAINRTDTLAATEVELGQAGEKILAEVEDFFIQVEKRAGDDLIKLADDKDLLRAELNESIRKAGNFKDLSEFTQEAVKNVDPFVSVNEINQTSRQKLLDALQGNIKKIIDQAEERNKNNKVRSFKKYSDELRSFFSFKDSKWFRYWKDDGQSKKAVRIRNEGEVLERFANNEESGEVIVEKGLEKLFGHVAGVGTFAAFAVPATSLREKLSGHARINVSKHWHNLTGSYDLATAARIDDMHTIIKGLAEATGAKVSDEVFYFLLRSSLRNK